jgi:hypothetical protein
MFLYCLVSFFVYIGACALAFINGIGDCKVNRGWRRTWTGKIKPVKPRSEWVFQLTVLGLPPILVAIGIIIFH